MRRLPLALLILLAPLARAADLADHLQPYLSVLRGDTKAFTLTVDAQFNADKNPQHATLTLSKSADDQTFLFYLDHEKYGVVVSRTPTQTTFAVPAHGVAFTGKGDVPLDDSLAPGTIVDRLLTEDTAATGYYNILKHANGFLAGQALTRIAGLQTTDEKTWTAHGATIAFTDDHTMTIDRGDLHARVTIKDEPTAAPALPADVKVTEVSRVEMERLVLHGVRRGLAVAAPSSKLTDPPRVARTVPHGELRWQGDQRLCLLAGTPAEIGTAHGQLLGEEGRRCADSALYLVGLAAIVDRGIWFPDTLRGAFARLKPFIPADHLAETDALADAAGISREEAHLANVFPEFFHCSGFALFGKATADGKLYHGRVLDYMTMVGLQDTATTFVVAPKGKIAFANVGYAGFIGSVSGMNACQVSLGEMGGRGQGKWDGTPMATLMRRALEECTTLDQVKHLWSTSPRTCEYYYVFADGKIPSAVACAATPESCDFLNPGESHELLGPGIPDAVVLSAGRRLQELRTRVRQDYGKIDVAKAQGLMCRPVAMTSNLHDVLFVPQDGVFYVANADHQSPAADRPYTRYDLNALLKTMPAGEQKLGPAAAEPRLPSLFP